MQIFFYNVGIRLYSFVVGLVAIFGNKKAQLWKAGRKNWPERLQQAIPTGKPLIWVHAASLGEFEQGRPVIEQLRVDYPQHGILLTFFSPSGYEIRKNYNGADIVCYLPADTKRNARQFVKIAQPKLAIFIKYEFWYHYLTTLFQQNIPTLLISGIFRPKQVFFKPHGGLFRQLLEKMTHLFVQNEESLQLLQTIHLQNASLAGDTRFDRVWAMRENPTELPVIETYATGRKVIACGSTWPADETLLANWWKNAKQDGRALIIAPHEIGESHIQQIEQLFPGAVRYSQYKNAPGQQVNVLIIDNVGMLSALYRYSYISYIGGGFGKAGIHNILEAATYNKPVLFGPNIEKFHEAVTLVGLKGAFVVQDEFTLATTVAALSEADLYKKTATIAGKFVGDNQGATNKIMQYIQEKRFLTIA